MNFENIKQFKDGFIECALWSSHDIVDGEERYLDEFVITDQGHLYLEKMASDWFKEHESLINLFVEQTQTGYSQAGHTHWLSMNGHGSGWFDFNGEASELLNKIDVTSEVNMYVGDDGYVHVDGQENVSFA